jgi:hypothetical protein
MNSQPGLQLQPAITLQDEIKTELPRPVKLFTLKLNKEGIKTFGTHLSSDGYASLLNNILMPFDLLFTYFFRYARVLDYDIPNSEVVNSSKDNGFPINTTMNHPAIGFGVWIIFAAIAASSAKLEWNRQVKNKNNHSAKYIYDILKDNFNKENKEEPSNTLDLDKCIKDIFDADLHLKKTYKSFIFKPNKKGETELLIEIYVKEEKPDSSQEETLTNLTNSTSRQIESGTPAVGDEARTPRHAEVLQSLMMKKLISVYNKVNEFSHLVINKFLFPIYQTLILASFVYWIEWIACGIITGDFDNFYSVTTTPGVPIFMSFVLPAVVALTYPVIKICNYFRNEVNIKEDEPTVIQQNKADKDFHTLMRKALARREFAMEKTALSLEIQKENNRRLQPPEEKSPQGIQLTVTTVATRHSKFDQKIEYLNSWFYLVIKPVVNFFSYGLGSFVALQYCTWVVAGAARLAASLIIPDISKPGLDSVSTFITGNCIAYPLLAISVVIGCYKAGEAIFEVLKQNQEVDENLAEHSEEFITLEEKLSVHQAKYGNLIDKKPLVQVQVDHLETQFFEDAKRHGPKESTNWKKLGGRVFQFINGGCTGIFIARAFTVQNSAIALPKFLIFSFNAPVTIGILAGVGIVFGAFKAAEYILLRKYTYRKNLLNTRTERLEYLRNEVEIADLREQLFKAKQKPLIAPANDIASTTVSVAPNILSNSYSGNLPSFWCCSRNQVVPVEEVSPRAGARVA